MTDPLDVAGYIGPLAGEPVVLSGPVVTDPVDIPGYSGPLSGEPVVVSGPHSGAPVVVFGDGAGSGGTLTFNQTTPVSVIEIRHNLGFRPQVALFSLDYSRQYDEFGVQHLSANALRVSMDQPTPCVVIMS